MNQTGLQDEQDHFCLSGRKAKSVVTPGVREHGRLVLFTFLLPCFMKKFKTYHSQLNPQSYTNLTGDASYVRSK